MEGRDSGGGEGRISNKGNPKSNSNVRYEWSDAKVLNVTTLKMARKPVKIQRKVQQDALGKVTRIKEISRRG